MMMTMMLLLLFAASSRRRNCPRSSCCDESFLQYKPKLATWDYKEISGAITTYYDIRGLTPYTEYEFVVLAVNNVGRGEKSNPVVATTGETGKR